MIKLQYIKEVKELERVYDLAHAKELFRIWNVDTTRCHTLERYLDFHNMSAGSTLRREGGLGFNVPQYNLFKRLAGVLTYRNVIIVERGVLAKALSCSIPSIHEKLAVGGEWLKVDTKQLRNGYARVVVHPALLFKCEPLVMQDSLINSLANWYGDETIPNLSCGNIAGIKSNLK